MHGQNHIKFVKFTFCFLWEFSWRRKDERYETDVQNLYIWFTNHLYTKKNLRQNLALLTSHIRSNSSKDPQALWTQFTASLFIIAWETSPVTRPTRRQRLLRYIWRHFVVSLTPDLKCSRPVTSAVAFKGIFPTPKHGIIGQCAFCHSLFFIFSCYTAHSICVFANVSKKDATDFIFLIHVNDYPCTTYKLL